MKALVVIDMLNDFVTGSLKNPRAEKIIPTIQELVAAARADRTGWLVVYANDAHLPQDFELRVWGEHAIGDTYNTRYVVAQIRRKLGDDPSRPRFIENEPGVGYRLIA